VTVDELEELPDEWKLALVARLYVGGVGAYRKECEQIVEAGYWGFAFGAGRRRALHAANPTF
jgi:hypothetical protein